MAASHLTAGNSYSVIAQATDGAANTVTSSASVFTFGTAPAITSGASTSFTHGTAGSFPVTTTGAPTPALTNANFGTCSKSTLPTGVTFHDNGDGTATIASTTASPTGTTTFCINAINGVSPNATQQFTLTIASPIGATQLANGTEASNTTSVSTGSFSAPNGSTDLVVVTYEDGSSQTCSDAIERQRPVHWVVQVVAEHDVDHGSGATYRFCAFWAKGNGHVFNGDRDAGSESR